MEEILAENEIVSSHYEIISLSDEKLVVIEKDGLTVQDYFDEVTLTLSLSDGTEVEIALSNPTPVEAGETVTTEGVGSFAADKEVPAGTKLMVNANPEVPEGITIGGGKKRGGPVESDPIFYDISLIGPDGKEIQTGANVTIATDIKLPQEDGKVTKVTDVTVYHVDEKGNAEPLEKADYALAEGKISSVSFATPGFSLFAVTYTVEYIAGGQEYSIVGGGVMSLRELLNALYVNIEIEEIDSVSFSNEELVRAAYVAEDTTAGALKEALGVEPSYSAELTEEEIAEMDALTLTAPDWALISLLPFKTDEKLTILLLDGQEYEIAVTDGQIVRYYIDSKGDTYEISVTFEDDAEIPEDATLDVAEIGPEDEDYQDYLAQALQALGGEEPAADQYARFFDITIMHGDEKVTPKAPVTVSIRLADAPQGEELKVVHFDKENGPVVMELEGDGKDILFETDSFSVYAVLYMSGAPVGVDNLDGRMFTICLNNRYMTSEIQELENTNGSSNFFRFTSTDSADSATTWIFEGTGETGQYYIYTLDANGQRQYMNQTRHGSAATDVSLSSTPQAYTLSKDDYGYSISIELSGDTFYLIMAGNNNQFFGDPNASSTRLALNFNSQQNIDSSATGNYAVIIKNPENGNYYAVQNDGSLVQVTYSEQNNTAGVILDYPLLWTYTSAHDGLGSNALEVRDENNNLIDYVPYWEPYNIRIAEDARGYDGNQLPLGYYYRYISPRSQPYPLLPPPQARTELNDPCPHLLPPPLLERKMGQESPRLGTLGPSPKGESERARTGALICSERQGKIKIHPKSVKFLERE